MISAVLFVFVWENIQATKLGYRIENTRQEIKEVIIRGVGNKVEIWNANSWKTYNKNIMEPSFSKFSKT